MSAVLFYTIGLPGAGKTTFAKNFSHWLNTEHLRGDKIGLELFHFPTYSPQERQMVYAEMNQRATKHLRQGRSAVYDAAINTRSQRDQLTALARGLNCEAVGVWVQVPILLAKSRAGKLRSDGQVGPVVRIIPPHIFDHYAAAFEAPSNDENVVLVSGDANFTLQYHRLRRQLPGGGLRRLI
jgi:predicted kinase